MRQKLLKRISGSASFRKLIGRPFLLVNEWIWNRLPERASKTRIAIAYGRFLHSLVAIRSLRVQYHGTYFLRNRPELDLMCSLLKSWPQGSTLRLAIVACSNGAEVYSFVWRLRSFRPDLKLIVNAIDISSEIVRVAKEGKYSLGRNELMDSPIFERLSEEEMNAMFDRDGDSAIVKPWIREGIAWEVGDAGDPQVAARLGPQDILVANRFLCHMSPNDAETCLRKLARIVRPGGYLFVSGVDLNVRTRVARELKWSPIPELLEEVHDGDVSVRRDWPWRYWGLEPFDAKRSDSAVRYASVFGL